MAIFGQIALRILVLNCGSSSIKYQLLDMERDDVLARGTIARIGENESYIEHETKNVRIRDNVAVVDQPTGLEILVKYLMNKDYGVIKDASEVAAVGHRVVHGGETLTKSTLITKSVIEKIEECIPLAPLHNPHNLAGIRAAREYFHKIPHVAVFDTAFHQTMSEKAFLYAIPYELYKEHKVRRYGFHGTSCRYVSQRVSELLGTPLTQLKIIVCHLGNGVTVDAIQRGESIDTSMGMTPVEGLMMGTRSGDVDPGVIHFLSTAANLRIDEIYDMLNRKSGLLGISGLSNDMREIVKQAEIGNERCLLAIEMYTYRLRKYIGAYAAALRGLDVIVFTAGVGSNSPLIRSMICDGLGFLGVTIDEKKNHSAISIESDISATDSKVKVLTIPTNEEKLIAIDTMEIAMRAAIDPKAV